MGQTLWIGQTPNTVGAGATNFTIPRQGSQNWTSPENTRQITTRFAGVFSLLNTHISANATTGASTFSFRKNTAAGNETVSIGSAATGDFEDTSNTDTVAAADILGYQMVNGGGGTISPKSRSNIFTTTTNLSDIIHGNNFNASFTATSTTQYLSFPVSGGSTTEANEQSNIPVNGTLKNLYSQVTSNGRSSTTTFGSRIGAATKNLLVSFAAAATGIVEDTSNTDTVVAANLVNLYCTLGTGVGTLNERALSCGFETTNNAFFLAAVGGGALAVTATTLYFNFGFNASFATEADIKSKFNIAAVGSLLWVYLSANTTVAASTIQFRHNAANGNQVVSPGAAATGAFQDTTNQDRLVPASLINLVATDGTGTITINGVTMFFSRLSKSTRTPSLHMGDQGMARRIYR